MVSYSSSDIIYDSDDAEIDLNSPVYTENVDANITPYLDQVFSNLDDAEVFYRRYATYTGFEIEIETSRKSKKKYSLVCSRMFTCRNARRPIQSNIDAEENDGSKKSKRVRDSVGRTDCKARMYISHNRDTNLWKVTKLGLVHNHEMVTPSKRGFMGSHRNITLVARNLIKTMTDVGIGPSKMMNILSSCSGGRENVGFTDRDVRNVVRDLSTHTIESTDVDASMKLLRELEVSSLSRFFYRKKVDVENRLACILWIDLRSIILYKNFGDVVTFDTTYRTNRYSMSFAPFTGVNNHYQSILFGFALMRDETEETFEWVMETWLEAMEYRASVTIITDQDRAMANAIAKVFPNTHHVLCLWHITSKFPEKLSSLYERHESFKNDFNSCIYSEEPKDFEARWENLMDKYNMHDQMLICD